MHLRMADISGVDFVFRLRNDIESRRNSFGQDSVFYEQHLAWYNRIMSDENKFQFILMNRTALIGQIRMEISDGMGEISYSISATERGKGYGRLMLKMLEDLVEEYLGVFKLVGKVKYDNQASANCFIKNGFDEYRMFKKKTCNLVCHKGGQNRQSFFLPFWRCA